MSAISAVLVLAFALFPVLAQASDSAHAQYQDRLPTATGPGGNGGGNDGGGNGGKHDGSSNGQTSGGGGGSSSGGGGVVGWRRRFLPLIRLWPFGLVRRGLV